MWVLHFKNKTHLKLWDMHWFHPIKEYMFKRVLKKSVISISSFFYIRSFREPGAAGNLIFSYFFNAYLTYRIYNIKYLCYYCCMYLQKLC